MPLHENEYWSEGASSMRKAGGFLMGRDRERTLGEEAFPFIVGGTKKNDTIEKKRLGKLKKKVRQIHGDCRWDLL